MSKEIKFEEYLKTSISVMTTIEGGLSEEESEQARVIANKVAEDIMKEAFEKDMDWKVLAYGGIAGMTAIMQAISDLLEEAE